MNNKTAAYACHILETDFETGIVRIQMLGNDYTVSSGIKYLSDTHPVKELTDEYKANEPQKLKETVTTITYTPQFKELTDAEIKEIAESYDWEDGNSNWVVEILFAKECIKKASEK